MASIDTLPPDQRAVLQLVLQRGRSYDEIAALLSIDRAAVRQRALDALEALTPAGSESAAGERSLITDYLLGQLPPRVTEQVRGLLQASAADNAWARAIARQLEQFSAGIAEIPALREPDTGVRSPRATNTVDSEPAPPADDEPAREPRPRAAGPARRGADLPPQEQAPEPQQLEQEPDSWLDEIDDDAPSPYAPKRVERVRERPAGNRRGGALLLGGIGVVVVVVVVLLIAGVFSGGSNDKNGTLTARHASGTTAAGSTKDKASTSSKTSSTDGYTILNQINLTAAPAYSTAKGIVFVVEKDGVKGLIVEAKGVPANIKSGTGQNAYAVWLSNPGGSSKFLGFAPNLVGKSGKLDTEGELEADATAYKQILITLETTAKPKTPGTVVFSGTFSEKPKSK